MTSTEVSSVWRQYIWDSQDSTIEEKRSEEIAAPTAGEIAATTTGSTKILVTTQHGATIKAHTQPEEELTTKKQQKSEATSTKEQQKPEEQLITTNQQQKSEAITQKEHTVAATSAIEEKDFTPGPEAEPT